MVNLSSNILILFAVAALLAFVFPLIKDGIYKQLTAKELATGIVRFACVIVPFVALFCLAGFLGAAINVTLPYFAGAALVFYVLSRVGLTPLLRGVLLLVCALLFSMHIPADGANLAISSVILGLLVGKVSDIVLLGGERSVEDLIAPLSWLGGVLWLTTIDEQAAVPMKQAILLGIISVCLLLRIVERPFMTDDRWLVKRVVLACTGGLGVLLVITKLLLAMNMTNLAALVGAGMFCTYLFQNIEPTGGEDKTAGIKLLLVIGMLTLAATRLFGMFGLVALAPVALLPPRFSLAQYVGLYFIVRALVQVFISVYNANVTGINLMHPYVGAAQYAGLIIVACLVLLLRDAKDNRVAAALLLGAAALAPIASNYYLHAEPTSSLLVAAAVGGAIFTILGPALQREENVAYENLLLVPAMMAAVGMAFSGLIDAGNSATNTYKVTVLAYIALAALVVFLIGRFAMKNSRKGSKVQTASE